MSCHAFGFKIETDVGINGLLAPFLASRDMLLEFGCLVWSVMDLMVLLFFCCCFWRLFLRKLQCWMVLFISRLASWKVRFCSIQFIIFQQSFDWGFQWTMRYQFFCSAILWVHGWGCCWGWWKFCLSMAFRDTLLDTVGLAGLGMDLMVLFFFCDFFWGMGMLKRPETIVVWQHWVGCSLLPGKLSNSPQWHGGHHNGTEGAIFSKQFTCLHWALNQALCLSK